MALTERVVVIGAGHNGLVCGLRLAAAGAQMLEQAPDCWWGGRVLGGEQNCLPFRTA